MAFKFPFTNYHELNLTWVLDQLKQLFEQSSENVTVIENYNGRLTAVETELPLVSETAQDAAQNASAASTLAQQAKSTADTAQENAIQAQGLAGQARQEAQAAQRAADAATQAAQQAQSVAQNFDGRITEAQNNASEALEASRSFENRVQAAITTANNASQTATNAQGIATRADQNAALALDTLNAQRSELERIGAEQVELITEETENGKTEIENLAQSVLDSIPADYTALAALVDKKAPVIINSASDSVASFDDGADNMKIQKLVVNIEPIQAGNGDPSPDNIRPISGRTGAEIEQRSKNLLNLNTDVTVLSGIIPSAVSITHGIGTVTITENYYNRDANKFGWKFSVKENQVYTLSGMTQSSNNVGLKIYAASGELLYNFSVSPTAHFERNINSGENTTLYFYPTVSSWGQTFTITDTQLELSSASTDYEPYQGKQISSTFPETIYGGENELISGNLKSTMRMLDLGSLNWVKPAHNNCFMADFNGNPHLIGNRYGYYYLSSMFKYGTVADNIWAGLNDGLCVEPTAISSTPRIFARLAVYNNLTAEEFKNVMNGVQVVYELEEPVEYTTTPQEMKTLYGANNIWANAGPVSVDYPADTKLYIDGKLAELQATILENI